MKKKKLILVSDFPLIYRVKFVTFFGLVKTLHSPGLEVTISLFRPFYSLYIFLLSCTIIFLNLSSSNIFDHNRSCFYLLLLAFDRSSCSTEDIKSTIIRPIKVLCIIQTLISSFIDLPFPLYKLLTLLYLSGWTGSYIIGQAQLLQ